jgi:hypothetical protein
MDLKTGQTVKVTIAKTVNRDAARKTLERLFMKDTAFAAPIEARAANHAARPKRRGGRIWTRYANKVHPALTKGVHANLKVTPQVARDLKSVADLVELTAA